MRRPNAKQSNNKYHPNIHNSSTAVNSIDVTCSNSVPVDSNRNSNHTDLAIDSSFSMASVEWDQLRREATKLERQLEDRVAKFQLLNANSSLDPELGYHSSNSASAVSNINNSYNSNLNGNDGDEGASVLASDIERTMSALTDLNERMGSISKRTGSSQQALLVKRYREILYEYNNDYQKAAQALQRRRESSNLFSGARSAMRNHDNDSATEHLLRERNAINNSLKSAGSVLAQASEIRSDLRTQRASLGSTMGYLQGIATNVPGLNHVMDAIRKKRNRDDVILSGVIATCILFTLWYLFG